MLKMEIKLAPCFASVTYKLHGNAVCFQSQMHGVIFTSRVACWSAYLLNGNDCTGLQAEGLPGLLCWAHFILLHFYIIFSSLLASAGLSHKINVHLKLLQKQCMFEILKEGLKCFLLDAFIAELRC